ncbi:hypothetical protein ABIC83_002490 [Roseateles asaccharophilus]|uniref:hypothetical protein n=1 Tax=Roseateles asaccharophilus TaxID=582607 RepID=UPI003839C65D
MKLFRVYRDPAIGIPALGVALSWRRVRARGVGIWIERNAADAPGVVIAIWWAWRFSLIEIPRK